MYLKYKTNVLEHDLEDTVELESEDESEMDIQQGILFFYILL